MRVDEKIKKWVAINQCDDSEKKKKKEKDYKNAFEISLSTTIVAAIIVIIILIVIIIIEINVDRLKDFDTLFICFVESFIFVSFLKEKNWEKISELDSEKIREEKFVCVACFFFWICRVRRRSFRLWLLWLDFDSFFCFLRLSLLRLLLSLRFWITQRVRINRRLCRLSRWKRGSLKSKKKLFLLRVFSSARLSVRRSKVCSRLFFYFWVKLFDFVYVIVCSFELKKVRNRSRREKEIS